jgi:hypothetical protein
MTDPPLAALIIARERGGWAAATPIVNEQIMASAVVFDIRTSSSMWMHRFRECFGFPVSGFLSL